MTLVTRYATAVVRFAVIQVKILFPAGLADDKHIRLMASIGISSYREKKTCRTWISQVSNSRAQWRSGAQQCAAGDSRRLSRVSAGVYTNRQIND
jgi:hypothetical protein